MGMQIQISDDSFLLVIVIIIIKFQVFYIYSLFPQSSSFIKKLFIIAEIFFLLSFMYSPIKIIQSMPANKRV